MAFDVGDLWTPQLTVKNAAGVLTAATVVCTVTSPSGVVTTPAVTTASTGIYATSVPLTEGGRWAAKWTVSGAVTGVETQYVDVMKDIGLAFADVKTHLNITADDHDAELQVMLDAAMQIIKAKIRSEFIPLNVVTNPALRLAIVEFVRDMWSGTQSGGQFEGAAPEDPDAPVFTAGRPALPPYVYGLLEPFLPKAAPTGCFPAAAAWPA